MKNRNYPSLETIKEDYKEVLKIIQYATTLDTLLEIQAKHNLGVEIKVIGNKPIQLPQYMMEDGTGENIEWFRYMSYGCLTFICCHLNNGKIESISFDVWTENGEEFLRDVTIDTLEDVYAI